MTTELAINVISKIDIEKLEEALITETPFCVDADGKLLPADILANTLRGLSMLERLGKRIREELRDFMIEHGINDVRIPGTPRDWLILQSRSGGEVIDAMKAGPILREWFTLEECDSFLSVLKGNMISAAKAKSPMGMKEKAAENLMEELRKAGAVTEKPATFSVAIVTKPAALP